MGLTLGEPAEDPALSDATRQERLEALVASARRIKDEFMAVSDRIGTLLVAMSAGVRRLVDDPSGDHSGLDEHLRDGRAAMAQLRALIGAHEAVERDLAVWEHQERLARGRVTAAGSVVELAGVTEAFAKLKLAAAAMGEAVAAATDASSSGGATTMDHD